MNNLKTLISQPVAHFNPKLFNDSSLFLYHPPPQSGEVPGGEQKAGTSPDLHREWMIRCIYKYIHLWSVTNMYIQLWVILWGTQIDHTFFLHTSVKLGNRSAILLLSVLFYTFFIHNIKYFNKYSTFNLLTIKKWFIRDQTQMWTLT